MQIIRTFIAASCAFLAPTFPAFAEVEPPWNPDGVVARIDIPVNGEPLQANVQLDGVDLSFIIDTGCASSVLSDVSRPGDEVLGDEPLPRRAIGTLRVAGIRCPWLKSIAVADLSHMRKHGIKADGIVGVDFLSHYVLHFDFDNAQFMLCNPAEASSPPGTKCPMMLDKAGRPCVEIKFGDRWTSQFVIDTGNLSCLSVANDEFAELQNLPDSTPTSIRISTVGLRDVESVGTQIRCRNMTLANHTIESVTAANGEVSYVGLPHLCRFRLTIDFAGGHTYWQRGIRFPCRDRGDDYGLAYQQSSSGNLEILSVTKDSLAERLGLQSGDLIVEVDGREAYARPIAHWSRVFSFPRLEPIKIYVKRSGNTFPLVIAEN